MHSGVTRLIAAAAVGLLLCSCSSLRYYAQAVRGQGALIVNRRPIKSILADPSTTAELASRLKLASRARQFASQKLGLPINRSYTGYVQLDRQYVVWNVFAAPRYSIDAVPQCFPIAGCVAYRGYFNHGDALRDAAARRESGDDVWVGGVPAYSTLGWFADPILSSMLRWDDDELDSTIFHELAHQLIYVKGDTAFNESFATFVQTEGLRQWRKSRGLTGQTDRGRVMDKGFTELVLDLRQRLGKLYVSGGSGRTLASGKHDAIEAFRQRYHRWQQQNWPHDHRYDAWVAKPINNARLLPFGLYDQWTPAFARLFQTAGKNWPAFYKRVSELARHSKEQRTRELQHLLVAAQTAKPVDIDG